MKTSRAIMAGFLIIGLTIMGLFISGCEKPKQAEAPKQETAPAPQAVQQPSSQTPAPPPAQLGKGSTDSTAQTAVPTEAKLNMQQGMNYLKSHDYDNAIKEFTVAIQKHTAYDVAYSNRAVAYMQQKKFNKAMDDLKKAEEINPNNSTVHYNFMALYSLQNQLDRALDSLDRALELGFNNYDALRTDPDLVNVRKHSEFRKILEKHKVFIYK
ncbi:MAG: tetratricopeptide repeat protein [Nitrospira sp.]|nr:tetratricopeptide repeat protein [Nitrospira sp.]